MQHTQNEPYINTGAHKPVSPPNKWVACACHEKEGDSSEREERERGRKKGGYVWPLPSKKFSKAYDRPLNAMQTNNSTKRGCETEASEPASSQQQWLKTLTKQYTITNIFPADIWEELLSTDGDVNQMAQQTQCPTVSVCINNCKIKMLVDTGSQLSVLNAAWIQWNKIL